MKALFIGLLAVLASTTASAQRDRSFDVTVNSGASAPTGEFGERYDMGFHLGVGLAYFLSPTLVLAPKLEYHSFPIDEDSWIETGNDAGIPATAVDGGTRRTVLAAADLRLEPAMNTEGWQPFVLGGLGAGFMSGSAVDYHTAEGVISKEIDGDTKLFWNVGVGLEFGHTNGMSLFIMGRYMGIPGDETEGFDFNAIPISIGVRF